jgi:hypothetical protein
LQHARACNGHSSTIASPSVSPGDETYYDDEDDMAASCLVSLIEAAQEQVRVFVCGGGTHHAFSPSVASRSGAGIGCVFVCVERGGAVEPALFDGIEAVREKVYVGFHAHTHAHTHTTRTPHAHALIRTLLLEEEGEPARARGRVLFPAPAPITTPLTLTQAEREQHQARRQHRSAGSCPRERLPATNSSWAGRSQASPLSDPTGFPRRCLF